MKENYFYNKMEIDSRNDLWNIMMQLPDEELMVELFSMIQKDFEFAFAIFVYRLFKGEFHQDAILNFKYYYEQYRDNLENNISTLSKLATVFVDEPLFLYEYEDVCNAIKKYLSVQDSNKYLLK